MLNDVVDRGINVAVSRRLGLLPDATLSLLPELGINMVLPSDELLYHMGWIRWTRGVNVAAVAAQFGVSRMRNPANSNIMSLIEGVLLTAAGTSKFDLDLITGANSDFATVDLSAIPRDARARDPNSTRAANCIISHETNGVGVTAAGMQFTILANTPTFIPVTPLILRPFSAYVIGNNTVNTAYDLTWIWRERILNDQENVP